MKQAFNLDREFIKWFFEYPYPDPGSNRAQVFSYGNVGNKENRDYWMRQGFMAGARAMAQESTAVLATWAMACEHQEPVMLEPSEVFDRARENLWEYSNTILKKAQA